MSQHIPVPRFSDYQDVLDYLYTRLPMFQRVGASAFRKDLTNTVALCEFLGHPEHQFKSIHIAGTNGKGSSSHYLAAILQSAGYKTGLYTSPHLKRFTERIRINGEEIPATEVVEFVNRVQPCIERIKPSFFEVTVGMAFDYFARRQVDIAVVEVGMGGRLDSTNVILPEVALITNISADHQQWLGNTLEAVAKEKAGIIKPHIPLVVSEMQSEVAHVFEQSAQVNGSALSFAADSYKAQFRKDGKLEVEGDKKYTFKIQPAGQYQKYNIPGILKVVDVLRIRGFEIPERAVVEGVEQMRMITGLKGRWQVLQKEPLLICDVGHNEAGIALILDQIRNTPHRKLYMILGMVNDKDVAKVLGLLPDDGHYYFCQANIPRAMPAEELWQKAKEFGLKGKPVKNVNHAIEEARLKASPEDMIFVGGSTFVVAEIEDL